MNSATKWYKTLLIYFLIMLISNENSCLKIFFNLMVSIFCKKKKKEVMLIYFMVPINIFLIPLYIFCYVFKATYCNVIMKP